MHCAARDQWAPLLTAEVSQPRLSLSLSLFQLHSCVRGRGVVKMLKNNLQMVQQPSRCRQHREKFAGFHLHTPPKSEWYKLVEYWEGSHLTTRGSWGGMQPLSTSPCPQPKIFEYRVGYSLKSSPNFPRTYDVTISISLSRFPFKSLFFPNTTSSHSVSVGVILSRCSPSGWAGVSNTDGDKSAEEDSHSGTVEMSHAY